MPKTLAEKNPRCYLCNHEKVALATKDIKAGKLSRVAIGKKYGCSDKAVSRHIPHIGAGKKPAVKKEEPEAEIPEVNAQTFINDMIKLNGKVKTFLDKELAKSRKNVRVISALSREFRTNMEMLIRIAIVQRKLDESLPGANDRRDVPLSIEKEIDKLFHDPELDLQKALPSPEEILRDAIPVEILSADNDES